MKKYLFILCILIFCKSSFGQGTNFAWAKNIGTNASNNFSSMDIDSASNIYATSTYEGLVDFDPGSSTFNLSGQSNFVNFFIVKLNSNGGFVWAKSFGGITGGAGYARATSLKVSNDNHIYITGYYDNNIDFDPNAGVHLETLNKMFLAKYDTAGNFIWVKTTTNGNFEINSVTTDKKNNVYYSGGFWGPIDMDPGINVYNISAGNGTFICKLDSNGNFIWAKNFSPSCQSKAILTDSVGNVFCTGLFNSTVDFDPSNSSTYYLTSGPPVSAFVSKLDSNGNFIWAKSISNAIGYSLDTDNLGNLYSTGSFIDTANFDPNVSNFSDIAIGSEDAFIIKYDINGNFNWAKTIKGTGYQDGFSIHLDNKKNIYTTGMSRFSNSTDLDPNSGIYILQDTIGFGFLSILDSMGNFVSAKKLPGVIGVRNSILDDNNNIFMSGYPPQVPVDYNPDTAVYILNPISTSGFDFYIMKLNSCTPIFDSLMISTCSSYFFNNQLLSTSGIYHGIFSSSNGCDSIVTLSLTINNSSVSAINQTACNSFFFNNQTLTISGTYYDTLVNANGCDSLITINLYITPTYNQTENTILCSGNNYTFYDGTIFTNINTDTFHVSNLVSAFGCDSMITTHLHIQPTYNHSENINLCSGNNYTFYDGVIFSNIIADTSHASHLVSMLGCDSIITTLLTITTIDTSITQFGTQLTSNAQNINYQWFDCTNQSILIGDTNQIYVASQNGTYAVILNNGSCTDTSSCYPVSSVSANNFMQENQILIYPNPANSIINIEIKNTNLTLSNMEATLCNTLGEVLLIEKIKPNGKAQFNVSALSSGVYYIRCEGYCKKIIKE